MRGLYIGVKLINEALIISSCYFIFTFFCRRPMEQPIVDEDPRKVTELFKHCEDGTKTLYYHL